MVRARTIACLALVASAALVPVFAQRVQAGDLRLAQSDAARRLDEKLRSATPKGETNTDDACARMAVPGFNLKCDTLIPFGALLGATPVSQTATSLADCAARCRRESKCVAFSYDAGAHAGSHSCYLTGSITRLSSTKNWISGTR